MVERPLKVTVSFGAFSYSRNTGPTPNNTSGQYADSGRRSARVGRQAFCAHPRARGADVTPGRQRFAGRVAGLDVRSA